MAKLLLRSSAYCPSSWIFRCYSSNPGEVLEEKRKKALLGGGERRIKSQHAKVHGTVWTICWRSMNDPLCSEVYIVCSFDVRVS